MSKPKIAPCLWFASEAEEAARFYVSIFPNSKVGTIARYGKAGFETHGQKEGTVLTVQFELNGQPYTALNGVPIFKFNEAVSLQIYVEDQKELDYYTRVLEAFDKALALGSASTTVDGKMIDVAMANAARRVLDEAAALKKAG